MLHYGLGHIHKVLPLLQLVVSYGLGLLLRLLRLVYLGKHVTIVLCKLTSRGIEVQILFTS